MKIAVGYKLNVKILHSPPHSADDLGKLEVEYIEMPGWNEDISKYKTISDLPKNARNYIKKIEELLERPYIHRGWNEEDEMIGNS